MTRISQDPPTLDVVLKRFEQPDEVRHMVKGRFELVRLGGVTIGRATYEPGWRWSEHVGPAVGAARCTVEHVGLVLQGVATVAFDDRVVEISSTSRRATTAGSSATSRTCHSIFLVQTTTLGERTLARLGCISV